MNNILMILKIQNFCEKKKIPNINAAWKHLSFC